VTRRTIATLVAVILVAAAVGFGLYARSASAVTPGVIAVAGDVRVDEYVVKAPAISWPVPDYAVGIPTSATPSPRKGGPPAGASRTPTVSGFMTDVYVTEGAHVTSGRVLARLDATMLDLGVAQAKAAQTRARTSIDVLDNGLDKIDTARAKLLTARAKLLTARASLVATIGVLVKTKASLVASIAAITKIINQPGGPPPHVPPYPVLLAGLKAGLRGLTKGLAGAKTGLAKMSQGLALMSKGLSQLADARQQLEGFRRLAVINLRAQGVAVQLAEAKRAAATIVSPVDGLVTFARPAGTVVMVGAPVVRIRPDGLTHVTTYLTADELTQVSVGSKVTVGFDSNPGGPLSGAVTDLGDVAVVPPTGFPTDIVHMTRAVKVTIVLDQGQTAPPGTPVDVQIQTGPTR
jgi:multidrug resistance efflux pump